MVNDLGNDNIPCLTKPVTAIKALIFRCRIPSL